MEHKRGDAYITGIYVLKIMCVVDNYVMARHTGCHPFCEHIKEFDKRVAKLKKI